MPKEFILTSETKELSATQKEQYTRLVIKSNDLIRKGCYKLTAVQQKLVNYLISDIKDTDTTETIKEYDIFEILDLLGIPNEHNEHLKEFYKTLEAVASKHWWWLDPDTNNRTIMSFFNGVTITPDNKLQVSFNINILPYLQALKGNYTGYKVFYILDMKSSYSMRLYEFLKAAEGLHVWYSKISYLKMLLDCENYSFKDFNQKIIMPSLAEINKKSDITVDYALYKKSRSYVGMEFYIYSKDDAERLTAERSTRQSLDDVLLKNHHGEYQAQERPEKP